jgi:2-oxoacid:acceptor oxidoreductase gamma subunit (pyruvate/2-ketoisovalerate family)/2-oxoacid:acceptor oxidoreductase delta subunit (pyruvate/2-ketoisovalerate family)
MEIRLHGRGGQGGVTCAKILAAIYARLGKGVQTFGDYAGERSGAPVRAYTRVADGVIHNRNKVYQPDHLVVLDPTLLGPDVLLGLAPGGSLLVNTTLPRSELQAQYDHFELCTVDATAIARSHNIGTRSVVIVNTTLAGAWVKIMQLELKLLEQVYQDLGLLSNFDAAKEAFEAVEFTPSQSVIGRAANAKGQPKIQAPSTPNAAEVGQTLADKPKVPSLTLHTQSPPTGLATGSWRTQTPQYREHLAPCNAWCPAGNDAIGFVQAVAKNGPQEASKILGHSTPLAGVCGRVCPAPCMEGCNRTELDGAVHIRGLERWIADQAPVALQTPAKLDQPQRIAIVGSGPAGLSAAYQLALAGHKVTLFEGEKQLGGVLRTGIPTYRLPREVLDLEVQNILALGVESRCGEFLNQQRLTELADEYDALIVATGLQWLRSLQIPGAQLDGVQQGIHYLHQVNLGDGAPVSGTVVVLGGGNTAMDCARSALRSGADQVIVAYRRSEREMPAIREEIEEAHLEGISFQFLRQPVAFLSAADSGKISGVHLAEVDLGRPDESGRRSPIVSDRLSVIPCDHVLLALGQGADLSLLPDGWTVRLDRMYCGETPLNVFAAGDLATGDGTVTHAIGSGRRVAGLVQSSLGLKTDVFERPDRDLAVPVTDIRLDHFSAAQPSTENHLEQKIRSRSFDEVNLGLTDPTEAHRCFSCGHCTECDTCLVYCPEGIIRRQSDSGYLVDYSYCKGCGICVVECPRSAMEMQSL